jgi:hypothetical protein
MNKYPNWGATDSELTRAMIGDFLIPAPTYSATLAVTVEAGPEQIWPWLVQMGYRRGGLYSYDWLDRLFGFLDRPSADEILPQYQHLSAGDEIPIGRGRNFPVREIAPGRALVLGGKAGDFEWIWQFGLYPLDGDRTRIVSRNAARIPNTLPWRLYMGVLTPAAFLMTRRMLIGLKRRAERLASERVVPTRSSTSSLQIGV